METSGIENLNVVGLVGIIGLYEILDKVNITDLYSNNHLVLQVQILSAPP